MDSNELQTLFLNGPYEVMSISKLCSWGDKKAICRLFLPPIQRSIVWSNEQVINYWDSLLRGYPPGMMLVHRAPANAMGRDINTGHTEEVSSEKTFQLFDGQQRMTAILLALGKGQMKDARRLWVDLGSWPNGSSGLKFQLRMSSSGQPFGYRVDSPNQKIELDKRRNKWMEWVKENDKKSPFFSAKGNDIIDAKCAVPFEEIYAFWKQNDNIKTIEEFSKCSNADRCVVEDFVRALEGALKSEIIVHEVSPKIVEDQAEYIRFFGRLGQGGTRLSDDELTYSIIKYCFPEVHDSVQSIMTKSGRLADEIDLVLATLRVVKAVTVWKHNHEWEQINRPNPTFVSHLRDDSNKEPVREKFLEMIAAHEQPAKLQIIIKELRDVLSYDDQTKPTGLPKMLFAHFPRELIDVLILFATKQRVDRTLFESGPSLRAFVFYWLLFVTNHDKAAWSVFKHATMTESWSFTADFFRELIEEFEQNGATYAMPRANALDDLFRGLRDQVKQVRVMGPRLCSWAERFTVADEVGEGLRVLSTNRKRIQLALMWIQREYISGKFPDYDPTSDRDEDLPIDLDHIIPHDTFGFDWRNRRERLKQEIHSDESLAQNFRDQRGVIGNSLGNFRWLDASDNSSRQNGPYEPIDAEGKLDLVFNPEPWNILISREKWGKEEIAAFQCEIDLRTIELFEMLFVTSGIKEILPIA